MNEMSKLSGGGQRSTGGTDPNSQISRKLREYYDSVQEETIPDRFLDLLEKLDEAEEAANKADHEQD